MGLGSTAKTLQRVADLAENVYSRLNDVREQLTQLRSTVQTTDERVARLESELAEQRAVIDALAEKQGIDIESVTAEIHIVEAEETAGSTDAADGEASVDDTATGNSSPDDASTDDASEATSDSSSTTE